MISKSVFLPLLAVAIVGLLALLTFRYSRPIVPADSPLVVKGVHPPLPPVQHPRYTLQGEEPVYPAPRKKEETTATCPPGLTIGDGLILGTGNEPIKLYHVFAATSTYPDEFKTNTAPAIIRKFSEGLTGSDLGNIVSHFYNGAGVRSKNSFQFMAQAYVTGPTAGTFITHSPGMENFIRQAVDQEKWAWDDNAFYMVFFSAKFASNFKTGWCAIHGTFVAGGKQISMGATGDSTDEQSCNPLYSGAAFDFHVPFNGVTSDCTKVCASGGCYLSCSFASVNNNPMAEGMISMYTHELFESITSVLYGWYNPCSRNEIADMCGFTYGRVYRDENGKHYNMVGSNGAKFLTQMLYAMPFPGLYAEWQCRNTAVAYTNASLSVSPPNMVGSKHQLWFNDWVQYLMYASQKGASSDFGSCNSPV